MSKNSTSYMLTNLNKLIGNYNNLMQYSMWNFLISIRYTNNLLACETSNILRWEVRRLKEWMLTGGLRGDQYEHLKRSSFIFPTIMPVFLKASADTFSKSHFCHLKKNNSCALKQQCSRGFFLAGERNVYNDFDDMVTEARILLNSFSFICFWNRGVK